MGDLAPDNQKLTDHTSWSIGHSAQWTGVHAQELQHQGQEGQGIVHEPEEQL